MNEFISIDMFTTFAGMVAFIALMTQAAKYFITININPRYIALIFSAIANFANIVFITQNYSGQSIFLALINTVIVALASTGAFEFILKPIQEYIADSKAIDETDKEDYS